MKLHTLLYTLAVLTIAALSSAPAAAHDDAPDNLSGPLADHVRAANDRFANVDAAVAEGYAPIPCASGVSGGAMGIHYVNAAYLQDDVVDISHPEAVMYEPMADGTMKLVAVEYITSKGPAALEGQLFNFNTAPNRYGLGPFYELHVWAWKNNATSTFADMNPAVSCTYAKAP